MSEFSFPTSLQYKMCPVEDKSSSSTMVQILIWLLQHKILLQYHMYIYFMPSDKGLVSADFQIIFVTFLVIQKIFFVGLL